MKPDDREIPHPYNAKKFSEVLLAEKLLTLQCIAKYTNLNHDELLHLTGHKANQSLDVYIHAIVQNSEENE